MSCNLVSRNSVLFCSEWARSIPYELVKRDTLEARLEILKHLQLLDSRQYVYMYSHAFIQSLFFLLNFSDNYYRCLRAVLAYFQTRSGTFWEVVSAMPHRPDMTTYVPFWPHTRQILFWPSVEIVF
jgi:hypothetical protein